MRFRIPSGYEDFCKPSPYCEANDPVIKNLAESITKNSKTEEEAAKALFEWVRDRVVWRIEKIVGAKKLLERKPLYGICADKANLFIALCRAINLPARYLMLDCELETEKKELKKLSHHMAAEVFVKGRWVIADPTFGKHTEKLVSLSEFGKEPWVKAKNVKRIKKLSFFTVWMANLFISISPSSKNLKKILEESSGLEL